MIKKPKAEALMEPNYNLKRKGKASLICFGAVVLWLLLWLVFPMEFYSLFFASIIGSNLLLAVLAAVVTIPFNFLFSKILRTDISFVLNLTANIILMLVFIYLYSIFNFKAPYLIFIAVFFHAAVCGVIFAAGRPDNVKRLKHHAGKIKLAIMGAVSAVLCDSLYFLLFKLLLEIFRDDGF